MSPTVTIRTVADADLDAVLAVERAAFRGHDEAELVAALLEDETAAPRISLLAWRGPDPVGHVLFTRARLGASDTDAHILAPLAVVPDLQQLGIGGALVQHGLALAQAWGTQLVFVLGHPGYYPRYGFEPALPHGFAPPYPIDPRNSDAWMVHELHEGAVAANVGTVIPADTFMRPEYWVE